MSTRRQQPTPTEVVGMNIRAELARAGITQIQLATHLGVKPAAVWARLTGRVPIDVNELDAIARLLNIPPAELIADR